MNNDLSTVTFDEILRDLHLSGINLRKSAESKPIEELISTLCTISSSVGNNKPYTPMFVPEEYKRQWKEYLTKGSMPGLRALRFLCWEPDIASNKIFIDCLRQKDVELSARSLQGIVRACHLRWNTVVKESVLKEGSLLEIVRGLVLGYRGPNRIIRNWVNSPDSILSSKGPKAFAAGMIKGYRPVKEYTESWAIDVQSEFFQETMIHAVQQCKIDEIKCRYLFAELLPWRLWGNSIFKKMIGEFILDRKYHSESLRPLLQEFVLSHSDLGDPRLPRNNQNWLDMDDEARDQFIQWLSKEDIGFFFEHVLPDRRDPHERKSFWLGYVSKMKSSRPLLCPDDEIRLRPLLRDRAKVGHFGKIRGNNSAFILDFGNIKAVEFSRVGACYIYSDSEFEWIVPNFWTSDTFTAEGLKDRERCIDRVRHLITYNVDWRTEVTRILARNGIRI